MTIETKFNVGDKLYTIDTDTMKMFSFKVTDIAIYHDADGTRIKYTEGGNPDAFCISEHRCFASEDELFNTIKGIKNTNH